MIVLENDKLKVFVNLVGGCLGGIIDNADGEQLMFKGDPDIWNYSDHILFPLVCRMADGTYEAEGRVYNSDLHGFAKDSEFLVEDQKADEVTLRLKSSAKTLEKYPYKFSFRVNYRLQGKSLLIKYSVENADDKIMYFALGAHPSFTLDGENGDTKGNFLYLKKAEYVGYGVDKKNCLLERPASVGELEKIELDKAFFKKHDTFIVERKSNVVKLVRKCGKTVEVECDSPLISIWSDQNKGYYACIESFWGSPDYSEDPIKELGKKKFINKLKPSELKTFEYQIRFN